eukprot:757579-Amphidinium_carterae.2
MAFIRQRSWAWDKWQPRTHARAHNTIQRGMAGTCGVQVIHFGGSLQGSSKPIWMSQSGESEEGGGQYKQVDGEG